MDKRNEKTDLLLQNTLLSLLKNKDIEKITVKEICDKSLVSRITFYAHYHDKYELFYKLIHVIGENIYLESKNNVNNDDYKNNDLPHLFAIITINVIKQCRKQKEIINNISYSEGIGKTIVFSACHAMIKQLFELVKDNSKKIDDDIMDYIFSFIIGGLSNMIVKSLNKDNEINMQKHHNDLVEFYKLILDRYYVSK